MPFCRWLFVSNLLMILHSQKIETPLHGGPNTEGAYVEAFDQGRVYGFSWAIFDSILETFNALVQVEWYAESKTYSGGPIGTHEGDYVCDTVILTSNEFIDQYRVYYSDGFSFDHIYGLKFRSTLNKVYSCGPISTSPLQDTGWIKYKGYFLSGLKWRSEYRLEAIGFQFSAFPTPMPTPKPSRSPTLKPSRSPSPSPTPAPSQMPTEKPSSSPTPLPSNEPSDVPTYSPTRCVDFDKNDDSQDGTNFIINDYSNYINFTQLQKQYHRLNHSVQIRCSSDECKGMKITLNDSDIWSYFVDCVDDNSCNNLFIKLGINTSLILRCQNSESCTNTEITSDMDHDNYNGNSDIHNVNDVIIICNDTSSCHNTQLEISYVTLFEIHCLQLSSCSDTQILINNANQSKIVCYVPNSCDSMNITTDSVYTQLIMYEYSEHIDFNNGVGINKNYSNIICSNSDEIRYIRYNTDKLQTNNQLVLGARHTYDQKLPCEDVIMHCDDRSCHVSYDFNISIENILDSPHSCYWFNFNSITTPICSGLCTDFSYHIHQIVIDIQLHFGEKNKTKFSCDNFFGGYNATKNSIQTVNIIYVNALKIHFAHNAWRKYVASMPDTLFIEENSSCNHSIYLSVTFEIRSLYGSIQETQSAYNQPSIFYNATMSLLQQYFGVNAIITTNVYEITIINIAHRGWFEQILIDYFSGPLTIFSIIIYVIIFIMGISHQKCCFNKIEIFCKNKNVTLYPVDFVKHSSIVSYSLRVVTNFVTFYFIYQLLYESIFADISKVLLSFNIIGLIFLSILPIISYCINFKLMWIWRSCSNSNFYEEWIVFNSKKVWILLMFSGSIQKTHALVSSRLLGLKSFLCPLSIDDYRTLQQFEFEDNYVLPRVVMLFIFKTVIGGINFNNADNPLEFAWIVCMVMSILNIIISILEYKWQKAFYYDVDYFQISIKLTTKSEADKKQIENRMYYYQHINKIVADICNLNDGRFVDIYHVKLNFRLQVLIYYGTKPISSQGINYNLLFHEFETLFNLKNIFAMQQQSIEQHLVVDSIDEEKQDNLVSLLQPNDQSNEQPQYGSVSVDNPLEFSLSSVDDSKQEFMPTKQKDERNIFQLSTWFKKRDQ